MIDVQKRGEMRKGERNGHGDVSTFVGRGRRRRE